ncbi:aminoglycoside phosphotransferase family protein [Streptomyces montanus]|uniref:Aminoglycoside phosphotransferase family protein n=1 Tax=Streptomyces montanus TaxID=2580423 RepID=A0A5R9FV05_9ACTN|nr:aminoglycoside phosphotransferase family protein [Streptomyces montanus]TLS47271.1 aminoglycoside phosphotransferase family protein [Streptomyces montanus]
MRGHPRPGRLLGSGRTADVYALDDEAWVLRRYRDGHGDAPAEAAVMEYVRGHGYPAPKARATTRSDLVMERLSGPTMIGAAAAGELDAREAGTTLARLLIRLHTIPPRRRSADPATRVLHLDLHPENVILTPDGPAVIDWDNTEEGPPGLDWGVSAVILAQVATDTDDDPRAPLAHDILTALLDGCPDPSLLTDDRRGGLAPARARRAANPTMSRREVELLSAAEDLIRTLLKSAH